MKDEITLKKEYKEVFTKLYAPENLRRKIRELSGEGIRKKKASLMRKIAIAAAVIIALFLGSNGIVYASTGKTWVGYLIKPGTEEWKQLGTVQNKIEACRIPEETLKQMSNAELIEAVLEYPFLMNIFLFGLDTPGTHHAAEGVYENCDALRELLSRRDGEEALRTFWEERTKKTPVTAREELENDAIGALLKELCE
ncbi:MAG: hypothetical protein IJX95_08600 [Lachnospiraceae bacterium]|nr:hypothetical protein [Lachnospiraceae bacterium]